MRTEVVERAQHGDAKAFEALAREVGGRLVGIAFRILRDLPAAEDAVQQTLVTAWRELPGLRDPERFEAWLYRILVRACAAEARGFARWAHGSRVGCGAARWAAPTVPWRKPRRSPGRMIERSAPDRASYI